jgi:adenine-specific DNA-methyltransferase
MNFIEHETPQKLRGGFYTKPEIADFLVRWVSKKNPRSVLEPSCGDGVFIESLRRKNISSLEVGFGCEIEPDEAEKAKEKTRKWKAVDFDIHTGDFLKWYLFNQHQPRKFDAVLGNPPFVRYQYLNHEQQILAEKLFVSFGLPFTKHTNAWVPFVIASAAMLSPGGRLAMVVPSEILHIPHARSLRRFLADTCSKILLIDPEELWFDKALQGVVLLLVEKKTHANESSQGVAIERIRDQKALEEDPERFFNRGDFINGISLEGKWMSVFLTPKERAILSSLRDSEKALAFKDVADVDVGIVTGANKFFLVSDEIVEKYGLQSWAYPMFGRSEYVSGVIYKKSDHLRNKENGLPTNFLWLDVKDRDAFPQPVRNYLNIGEEEGLTRRFKCRTRTPWYIVPSVYLAPVAMLKRAHNIPRLVLNQANAFTTDTAYRIKPRGLETRDLVFRFVNSLTCLTAELEGRHYGGGVLELVPTEIERLLLPNFAGTKEQLADLDKHFRKGLPPEEILTRQDQILLKGIGFSKSECEQLLAAWTRLRDRRQRNHF